MPGRRWLVLAALLFARAATGFQFQSVGSSARMLMQDLEIEYSQFGMLWGAYLLPGAPSRFRRRCWAEGRSLPVRPCWSRACHCPFHSPFCRTRSGAQHQPRTRRCALPPERSAPSRFDLIRHGAGIMKAGEGRIQP
jgi:hypothetical protein